MTRTPFRLFVFFQAEDGIRDIGVTGVQTCALPISGRLAGFEVPQVDSGRSAAHPQNRSEERRVGKECRFRWSPSHLKKKGDVYTNSLLSGSGRVRDRC